MALREHLVGFRPEGCVGSGRWGSGPHLFAVCLVGPTFPCWCPQEFVI